jgi:Fe2+ transport system protein FeoA
MLSPMDHTTQTPDPPSAEDVPCTRCTLADARRGQHFTVTAVDDEHARVTCLRFGMAEGARVSCVTRIPAGPIVLRSGRQEIAVGRELAKRISVRPADEHAPRPATLGEAV